MKVKKNLFQNCQDVGESLWQDCQNVGENLRQDNQIVGKDLMQQLQNVKGVFYNHKLKDGEYWKEEATYVVRRKKLKEITLEELEKMGFKLKEEKEDE